MFHIALLTSASSRQDYETILSILTSFRTIDEWRCQVRFHMESCEGTVPINIYSEGVEIFVVVVWDTLLYTILPLRLL
jgi:hypothetical protein